jgi:methionine-gamma-lyase
MTRFDPIESLANMRHEFGEHGGVNMCIETSTTFTVMDAHVMPELFQGQRGPEQGGCYLYGRHFNPTVYVLGKEIAALEGAEAGYCTASGMSAISSAVLQLCNHGDHVVSSNTVYGGTFALLHDYLPGKANIETSFVNTCDLDAVRAAFTDRTRVLYVETVSNPTLRLADIPKLAEIAHERGARLVVDNTFTPLIFSPIQMGADVVVHSLTKFINGASDVIGGAVCGTNEFIQSMMDLHHGSLMLLGPTMDPQIAYAVSMRLPHLGIRVTEHSDRAEIFAGRLCERGVPVIYPGLSTHPDHDRFGELAHPDFGYGGILCIDLEDQERAYHFMGVLQNRERFGFMAVSLGYFDTLMSASASSTSSEMGKEGLREAGISPGLVRISLGYTGTVEQRWAQMERALEEVGVVPRVAG